MAAAPDYSTLQTHLAGFPAVARRRLLSVDLTLICVAGDVHARGTGRRRVIAEGRVLGPGRGDGPGIGWRGRSGVVVESAHGR